MRFNAEKNKSSNTALLRSEGIEVVDHLPHLDQPKFRSSTAVAERCLVLAALVQLHFGAPRDHLTKWLKENQLDDSVTAHESQLLGTDFGDLPQQRQIDVYWFIEAIWALAWVGELHQNLSLNTPVEDSLAAMLPSVEKMERTEKFVHDFALRGESEIFSTLDYFYRAHWFARNCQLAGSESDLANLDIIMERRKALEWVCDSSLDWDDVPLDT